MLILGRNSSIFLLLYIFNNHLCFQNSSAIARQLLILLYYPLDDILQIFYDKDDLNSGLYEGTVRGRRLFTSSAIPHGQGTIYYFNNDKYHRVNYTGDWVDGTREGNGTTNFKDGSVYRGISLIINFRFIPFYVFHFRSKFPKNKNKNSCPFC